MNQRKRRLETGGVFVCTEDGVSAANGVVVSEEQFCWMNITLAPAWRQAVCK
jgi:hypothetical protein